MNKIQLSGPTLASNTYAGKFANAYIAAALLSGDTLSKNLVTIHPGVAYKEVIRNWQDSISIDAGTCDFTDTSSVTLDEVILTANDLQVNLQLCKKNLQETWEAAQNGYSPFAKLPKTFNDFLIAQVAAGVSAQVEQGIWSSNLFFTGAGNVDGLTGYLLDNAALTTLEVTATTSTNVVARLQSLYDNIPNATYGKEGLAFYVSAVVMKAYQTALSAGNYNFQGYVSEKPMDFQGIPVIYTPGIVSVNATTADEVQVVLGNKKDFHFGTNLIKDFNTVQVIDMSPTDGSQNVRVVMRFTGGVVATNPTEQMVLHVDIP